MAAIVVLWIMLLGLGASSINDLMRTFMKGAEALLPIATILLFALALGDVAQMLGTGVYIAGVVGESIPGSVARAVDLHRLRIYCVFGGFELGNLCDHDTDRHSDSDDTGFFRAAVSSGPRYRAQFSATTHRRSVIRRWWHRWPPPPITSIMSGHNCRMRWLPRPSPRPCSLSRGWSRDIR